MFGIGQTELIILALVLVFLFGSSKLPSLMRNLGRSATEFKKGMKQEPDDDLDEPHVTVKPAKERRLSTPIEKTEDETVNS